MIWLHIIHERKSVQTNKGINFCIYSSPYDTRAHRLPSPFCSDKVSKNSQQSHLLSFYGKFSLYQLTMKFVNKYLTTQHTVVQLLALNIEIIQTIYSNYGGAITYPQIMLLREGCNIFPHIMVVQILLEFSLFSIKQVMLKYK